MTINLCDTGCGNVALVGTNQCLQHLDAGARVPVPPLLPLRDVDELLEQMGAELDAQDFTAAADSVRPEIADAIQAADTEAPGEIVSIFGTLTQEELDEFTRLLNHTIPIPAHARAMTLDDVADMMGTPGELHRAVVIAEATAEPRRSIVGRIWRRFRRWTR